LILLNDWETDHGDLIAIGAGDRQTISLLFVPIHNGAKIIGVLSIQSYWSHAYDQAALDTLQALADHCGGALERIAAEEQMRSSLHEKEVLLKEIYHRVKNNLQVVSSLLNLQSQRVADLTAVEVLRESQHRVRSMALIHERLYKSSDLARINFADYMRDLATFLFRSYNTDSATVQLQVIAEQDVQLNINTAIPCGLIVNELLSNALKHAFPDGRQGTVTMQLTRDTAGHISLSVADNGIGLPAEIDIDQTESLGLQLVKTLVQQIDGTLRLDRQSGTSFIITLPVVHEDPAD
jgi:two-component sensor histidine kinase